ncbi:hypothetical protein [Corynebacterium glutamicum]|uniref:hypothetical protein n=1 Tax=Corynebacterium glutamicum TaxID=1718 RepID=UPI000681716A|nr:hypothetical protein [Corynebacterium glutamicum]
MTQPDFSGTFEGRFVDDDNLRESGRVWLEFDNGAGEMSLPIDPEATNIKNAALAEISTSGDNAVQAVGVAKNSAVQDVHTARDSSVQSVSTAGTSAVGAVNSARDSAVTDVNTAKSDALTDIEAEVGKAEDAADRAENAVNDGVGDGSVTVAKLAQDVKDQINGKADLVGGKVPTSQIPEVALTKPFSVASRTALLALDAQEGDIGIITAGADKGTYILGSGPANVFSSWVQLAVSADAPVQSVNGQTGTVVLSAENVGASPTGHTHTSADIVDKRNGVWSGSTDDGRLIATSGGGYIQTSKYATQQDHVTNKKYVDDRTPDPTRQEVTGTNGVTTFEKRGNVVHVASTGTHLGVTIPADFRPTQTRRVAVPTGSGSTNVGNCTLNTDGTIVGGWAANSAFSYLTQ